MRTFNRILLALILLVILVFAAFTAAYSFAQDQYEAAGIPGVLSITQHAEPIQNWLGYFEAGSVPQWQVVILGVAFFAGLALLILELTPRRKSAARFGAETAIEKDVIETQAESVALSDPAVLESRARLRPKRGGRSRMKLDVVVREGQDPRQAEERVTDMVRGEISERGRVGLKKTKVRATVKDPRDAKRRVK